MDEKFDADMLTESETLKRDKIWIHYEISF